MLSFKTSRHFEKKNLFGRVQSTAIEPIPFQFNQCWQVLHRSFDQSILLVDNLDECLRNSDSSLICRCVLLSA